MLTPVITYLLFHIHFWWFLSVTFRRNDIADVGWGLGILGIGISLFYQSLVFEVPWRKTIFLICLSAWAIRLGYFIFKRLLSGPEDYRYKEMRDGWKSNHALNSYLKVFWFQGLLMTVVALPVIQTMNSPRGSNFYLADFLGLSFFILGFSIESIADAEKKAYFKNPENHGTFIRQGLWKKCRHPNYFGEIILWVGLSLFSFSDFPNGIWALIGPICLTALLLKVTGIPPLEKRMNQRPGWEEYKKQTRALWPF